MCVSKLCVCVRAFVRLHHGNASCCVNTQNGVKSAKGTPTNQFTTTLTKNTLALHSKHTSNHTCNMETRKRASQHIFQLAALCWHINYNPRNYRIGKTNQSPWVGSPAAAGRPLNKGSLPLSRWPNNTTAGPPWPSCNTCGSDTLPREIPGSLSHTNSEGERQTSPPCMSWALPLSSRTLGQPWKQEAVICGGCCQADWLHWGLERSSMLLWSWRRCSTKYRF